MLARRLYLSLPVRELAHLTPIKNAPLWHFRNSENATVTEALLADDELVSKYGHLQGLKAAQILPAPFD